MPGSSGSLVITKKTELNANILFSTQVTLQVAYILNIYYHTSFQYSKLHGASVPLTSLCITNVVITDCSKLTLQGWGGFHWH